MEFKNNVVLITGANRRIGNLPKIDKFRESISSKNIDLKKLLVASIKDRK